MKNKITKKTKTIIPKKPQKLAFRLRQSIYRQLSRQPKSQLLRFLGYQAALRKDLAYLKSLDASMKEWASSDDEKAYKNLLEGNSSPVLR